MIKQETEMGNMKILTCMFNGDEITAALSEKYGFVAPPDSSYQCIMVDNSLTLRIVYLADEPTDD